MSEKYMLRLGNFNDLMTFRDILSNAIAYRKEHGGLYRKEDWYKEPDYKLAQDLYEDVNTIIGFLQRFEPRIGLSEVEWTAEGPKARVTISYTPIGDSPRRIAAEAAQKTRVAEVAKEFKLEGSWEKPTDNED